MEPAGGPAGGSDPGGGARWFGGDVGWFTLAGVVARAILAGGGFLWDFREREGVEG